MELPNAARQHLAVDKVAWLTTITSTGAPSPTPVWFVPDGDAIVVYTEPGSRKARNLRADPRATFHFNSDPDGQDIVVVHATAELDDGRTPSIEPGYVDKYRNGISSLGMTVEQFDAAFPTRIRLTPERVWLGPTG